MNDSGYCGGICGPHSDTFEINKCNNNKNENNFMDYYCAGIVGVFSNNFKIKNCKNTIFNMLHMLNTQKQFSPGIKKYGLYVYFSL